jgi:hypothetical protein
MDLTRQSESLVKLADSAFEKKSESKVDNLKEKVQNTEITINLLPMEHTKSIQKVEICFLRLVKNIIVRDFGN